MNTDRLLTAGIALCCIFAIGTSASTLGSSVSTNPDEVINPNYESLPINPTEAGELKEDANTKDTQQSSSDSSNSQQQQQQDQQNQQQQQQSQQQQSNSETEQPQSLLDRLLELLRWLLAQLLWLLPLLALVGVVAAGVRFRDRLLPSSERDTDGPAAAPTLDPDPSNEIERAWWEMVDRAGVDGAHTKTPRECAADAIDAGADPEAVETLTRMFEEVRYGGAPVTDDRVNRARNGVEGVVGR